MKVVFEINFNLGDCQAECHAKCHLFLFVFVYNNICAELCISTNFPLFGNFILHFIDCLVGDFRIAMRNCMGSFLVVGKSWH